MFGKKINVDVKKSTSKIQDSKKDSATRLKHLKLVLENVELSEAKGFFEANFSHVYQILYESFIQAEANLKQRVHKAHKEELEMVLWLLQRVLTLLPELLHKRWQLHSLSRLLLKLLHVSNSCKLRRDALRYFLMWYQALGDNCPDSIHSIFATLVPGFPNPLSKQHSVQSSVSFQTHSSVFHDINAQHPVSFVEVTPLLPPSSGEKSPENLSKFYLEALLDFMVSTVVRLEWHDQLNRQHKCFQFLLDRFKMYYLPYICPNFNHDMSLYRPRLDLPTLRKPEPETEFIPCRVALIKWVAHYTHVTKKLSDNTSNQSDSNVLTTGIGVNHNDENNKSYAQQLDSSHPSLESNISINQSNDPVTKEQIMAKIVRDVFYNTRENVNFVHEVYRQAFTLNFTHSIAIRKAIAVYKDLIQMNLPELPNYMLEPLDSMKDDSKKDDMLKIEDERDMENIRQTRLRNDSYLGAIHRENLLVRAGLQNVLRIFMTHAANVFLVQVPSQCPAPLEEQTDACKRVLNIYRYMVMHTRMDSHTWEQLLLVLLQITSLVLNETPPKKKNLTLGGKLAPAIFQTLIVTWIKANLNVVISRDLWDRFLHVLMSLTQWEELIKEWAKTMDTLTRVLARHVYGLDMTDLPLDRLSEQKSKKNRRGNFKSSIVSDNHINTGNDVCIRNAVKTEETTMTDGFLSRVGSGARKLKSSPLSRCYSETTLINRIKPRHSYRRSHRLSKQPQQIPTIPASVEQQIIRLLASPTLAVSKSRGVLRKAASLDSLPRNLRHTTERSTTGDDSPERSRTPSPAPSSGVESNSIKDSPMQIDMLGGDGGSLDTANSSGSGTVGNSLESSGVVCGGSVRGWLPDVAVVLWRRMLAALGDPNQLSDPRLHAMMFDYFVKLTDTLIKIYQNQGVSLDNMSTPAPPELIPPLTLIVPWCLGALTLPGDKFKAGKLTAHRLLATITQNCSPGHRQHIPHWFRELHRGLCGNDRAVLDVILRYLGPRFLSLNLQGHTILLLDLIHACGTVLNSSDISSSAPRTEAVSILGGMLSLPPAAATLPVLQPNSNSFNVMTCPDLKEHVVGILLRVGRREPTGTARCIALSSLGMFVYRELVNNSNHSKVKDAINVLLLALKFNNKSIAQISSDVLLLLCDNTEKLSKYYPHLPNKIISTLAATLSHLIPSSQSSLPTSEKDKSLITSLLLCLGEWCMRLGPEKLLEKNEYGDNKEKCLLLTVFQVLYQMTTGEGNAEKGLTQPNLQEDFDPNILVDNLCPTQSSSPPNSPNKSQQWNHAVQLCAKMVLMHLVTHLGHFPMAIGAGRLSSLVVENDDVPDLNVEELSAQIFTVPNIQLFMLNSNTLASFIELPALEMPGGGITAGLITAEKQVRVILRDLSGKASWDASILYHSPDHSLPPAQIAHETQITAAKTYMNEFCNPAIGDSLMVPSTPLSVPVQRALRHRSPDVLPNVLNAAADLDQLDDLLQYLGHTSPECLQKLESQLNEPTSPPFSTHLEAEIISAVLSQRNAEMDYISQMRHSLNMQPRPAERPAPSKNHSAFQYCRLLFSQLGLTGWERRKDCYLLSRNEKLLRELRNLDTQRCRETHKVAVIYVAAGQEDKNSILSNSCGSQAYENFISCLAWEVELESHTGFMGGLQRQGTTGETAPYYATSFNEVIFHVATRMPSDSQEGILSKTRHLGNDEVHIVWSEHCREYRRGIIPTEFCDVLIVIYPLKSGLFRITINRKPDVPYFGPLFDEAIVESTILAGLVRATAISASRAKRTILPFYQQYYEERARSIETVVTKHKEKTTFEEFAARVYSPIPTVSPCCPVANNIGNCSSGISNQSTCSSAPSSTLAAALLDHSHTHRVTLRQHTEHKFHTRASDSSKGVWFSNMESSQSSESSSSDVTLHHGISPRPFKKLSNTFKNVPRRSFTKQESNAQSETPPESPTLPPRKGRNN